MPFAAQHLKAGRLHLMKSDPTMKKIIKLVGPFTAKTKPDRFGSLVDAIIGQQISLAAAATIKARLLEHLNNGKGRYCCLLYTSPSPRDATLSRMPSSA